MHKIVIAAALVLGVAACQPAQTYPPPPPALTAPPPPQSYQPYADPYVAMYPAPTPEPGYATRGSERRHGRRDYRQTRRETRQLSRYCPAGKHWRASHTREVTVKQDGEVTRVKRKVPGVCVD